MLKLFLMLQITFQLYLFPLLKSFVEPQWLELFKLNYSQFNYVNYNPPPIKMHDIQREVILSGY